MPDIRIDTILAFVMGIVLMWLFWNSD